MAMSEPPATVRFLGQTLHRLNESERTWSTPNREPWPHVTLGEDISGSWFAIVHMAGPVPGVTVQFLPSERAARTALRKRLKTLKDQLGRLDI